MKSKHRSSAIDGANNISGFLEAETSLSIDSNTTNELPSIRVRNETSGEYRLDRSDNLALSPNTATNFTSSLNGTTNNVEGNSTGKNEMRILTRKSNSEFGVLSKIWYDMKKIIGFSSDCKNDGRKNLRGDCICPKYFDGDLCEHLICLNGGTAYHVESYGHQKEYCRCPHPDFIFGKHCEVVRCHNGGRDLGNGHCGCVDGWYTGRFCQYYSSSWLIAIGIPFVVVALLIICCVICRLDFCPRRRTPRNSRRQRYYLAPGAASSSLQPASFGHHQVRRPLAGHCALLSDASLALINDEMTGREQALLIQQNLLNERRLRQVDSPGHVSQGYVVRLEHIPVFNPQQQPLAVSSGEYKIEPPPPYEQAVQNCPSLNVDLLPPNYSPPRDAMADGSSTDRHQPPPPNRPPPMPRRD